MNIVDKRNGSWQVIISYIDCPFVTYPRSDVACSLLENDNQVDTYCCYENCPMKDPKFDPLV